MYSIILDKEDFLRYQLFSASQSKRIRNKKTRSWIFLSVSFFVIGLIQITTSSISYWFFGLSVITFIFYPLYQRREYRKHYENHIDDNYKNRVGVESKLGFDGGYIVSIADNQEGRIKISEIEEINEIADNLFIRVKTGESIIIPSRLSEYNEFKIQLADLITEMDIEWKRQLDWKWK